MPIERNRLLDWPFEPVEQNYSARDTILYALGIGLGGDPTDLQDLRFLFEEADGFASLPTMPVVLGTPGFWLRDPASGVDWRHVLHGEQGLFLHGPVPTDANIIAENKVVDVLDKGAGKGALIYIERNTRNAATGDLIATLTSTTFARADGGFGGPSGPTKPVHPIPDRTPDRTFRHRTLPQSALIYRLCGDPNPLHAAPDVAHAAGFDRPILHGLCTFGIAGLALLRTVCEDDPTRLASMELRFSAPVLPGEEIDVEIWEHPDHIAFRARVGERIVLNNGRAMLSGADK